MGPQSCTRILVPSVAEHISGATEWDLSETEDTVLRQG